MPKHYRPAGKKKEGNAARYITRSQAVKYLQVSLSVFRRLCIFKGVFPRDPKKKVKGNHHTYYHMKDILFLKHEPLLDKFREMRAYEKKVKKAMSKKNKDLAERLLTRKPTYTLDMLIRERYPKFIDALRDLDDCLTMVHLFAALPAIERENIQAERIHNCRGLSLEWQAYISRTHKLRKAFISVKGIYYQAEVEGQKVTWLTPHALQQVMPQDVDYKIMLTFLEFYETLLGFVNLRLYHSIKLKYPPILDPRLKALAADLYALTRYADAKDRTIGANNEESELRLAQLQDQLPANEPGALMHLVENVEDDNEDDEETKACKTLFQNKTFFLGREVPRESLLFVITAFGGVVSWDGDGAPFEESNQDINYQIVDRPTQSHRFISRDYIQPQWVFDCINARIILPTEDYMVGKVLPPHLSPFVDNEAEGYVPEYAETIKRLQAAARKEILPMPGGEHEDLENAQSLLAEGVIDRTEAKVAAENKQKMALHEKQYHQELKKEMDTCCLWPPNCFLCFCYIGGILGNLGWDRFHMETFGKTSGLYVLSIPAAMLIAWMMSQVLGHIVFWSAQAKTWLHHHMPHNMLVTSKKWARHILYLLLQAKAIVRGTGIFSLGKQLLKQLQISSCCTGVAVDAHKMFMKAGAHGKDKFAPQRLHIMAGFIHYTAVWVNHLYNVWVFRYCWSDLGGMFGTGHEINSWVYYRWSESLDQMSATSAPRIRGWPLNAARGCCWELRAPGISSKSLSWFCGIRSWYLLFSAGWAAVTCSFKWSGCNAGCSCIQFLLNRDWGACASVTWPRLWCTTVVSEFVHRVCYAWRRYFWVFWLASKVSELGFRVSKHQVWAVIIHRSFLKARDTIMWLGHYYVSPLKAQGWDSTAQAGSLLLFKLKAHVSGQKVFLKSGEVYSWFLVRNFGRGVLKVLNPWSALLGCMVLGGIFIHTPCSETRKIYYFCICDRLDEYTCITQCNVRFFCSPRRDCMVSYFWSPKHVLGMIRGNAPLKV